MAEKLPEPRKRPKQSRSKELVEAIRQACLHILEMEGPDKLTTHRIAEVAGVNIGSLYQYFPNKDAVVAEVYNAKLAAEAEETLRLSIEFERLADHSLEETLRAIVRIEVELQLRLLRLDEEFYKKYHRALDVHSVVDRGAVALEQPSMDEWFPTLLERHRERLCVDDLALATFLATRTLEGVLRATVDENPDLLATQAFQEQLVALLLRYLAVDSNC